MTHHMPFRLILKFQCPFRTLVYALHTENTLGTVFMLLGEVENFDIHWAVFFALFAANAFVGVQLDMEEGKAAGWFQEDCDRADIFAESPVVFADESQCDANDIIEKIADEKTVPHNSFDVLHMQQEEAADKNQGAGEYNITDKSPFLAGSLRRLKGK